jgi:hypothetical protein
MTTNHENRLDEARAEARDELLEIADELREIRDRADQVLRAIGGISERRARAYWYGQLSMLIGADHEYLGNAGHSLQQTIEELDEPEEE